uniref:Cyclic nucleotide-binding domain-containing protein n=1 Tax=Monodelphis domestica TaxID=13616 RepID=F6URL5_MONDO
MEEISSSGHPQDKSELVVPRSRTSNAATLSQTRTAAPNRTASIGQCQGRRDISPLPRAQLETLASIEDEREFMRASQVRGRYQRRSSIPAEAFGPSEGEEELMEETTVVWAIYPKSEEQVRKLKEACKDLLPFRGLEDELLLQIFSAMFEKKVLPQEHVVEQGEDGDHFYVIEDGIFDVIVQNNSQHNIIGQYKHMGAFGELALMYSYPRPATIVAITEGSLWGLDRPTFRTITVTFQLEKKKKIQMLLSNVPFFKSLEDTESVKILDVVEENNYQSGECIFPKGQTSDKFYIVESGEVKIVGEKLGSKEAEIVRHHEEDFFGESALISNKPRTTSAYAVGKVKCIVMDVQALERVLGPYMDILKRDMSQYEELIKLLGPQIDTKA